METETFIPDDVQEQESYTEISEIVTPDIVLPETDISLSETSETTISGETTSETTETTVNYLSEISENTAKTAECVSYLSGLSIILISVLICSAILKVFFSHNF